MCVIGDCWAGIHLIKHTAYRTLERGGQFILLGSAPDPKVQGEFNALNNELRSENAAFCFTYDEPLSHLIYAGCDLIVVPSMFEPCGLTQVRSRAFCCATSMVNATSVVIEVMHLVV